MATRDRGKEVPFAAGVVGSLPRPRAVIDMLPDTPGAESADAARSPRMDAAAKQLRRIPMPGTRSAWRGQYNGDGG